MRYYENIWIARQELGESQIQDLLQKYKSIIEEYKGSCAMTEYWGLRKLAYPINKNARGHYVFMSIEASVECLQEVERQMSLSEDVLRFLTTRTEKLAVEPTIMMRAPKRGHDDEADAE